MRGATLYTVLCLITMRAVVECRELVEGRELLADLILLDVLGFDVILGIDWLAQHYISLDYREKVVIFRIPNDEEFRFRGDKSSMP